MSYVERELGELSVSIGTSLGIEGYFGTHPNQTPIPPSAKQLNNVWINVRTLVRNYFAAFTSDNLKKITLDQAISELIQEMETLGSWFAGQRNGRDQVTFYHAPLDDIKWMFPGAKHRRPKTEKQHFIHHLESKTVEALMEHTTGVLTIIRRPPPTSIKVAVMTHHPHELLWRPLFDLMYLLESHTGKLKGFGEWYTKLNTVRREDNIPFNSTMLQIFGDGTLFDGQPKKMRDEVKQIALTRKWSAITTNEKLNDDIRRYGSGELSTLVKQLAIR